MPKTLDIQQHLDIDHIHRPAALATKICMSWQDAGIHLTSQGEGVNFRSNGLYDLLDDICAEAGYAKSKISIDTWNLLEEHDSYDIRIMDEIYDTRWFYKLPEITIPNPGKILILMGRASQARLRVHELVQSPMLRNKLIYSFHMDLDKSPWPSGMQKMLMSGSNYGYFHSTTPHSDIGEILPTPIIPPKNILKMQDVYDQAAVELVVETVTGQGFFVTEKTLRPIYYGRPFIPIAPHGYESNLRKLGFNLDFGFTNRLEDFGHMEKIVPVIDYLNNWQYTEEWFAKIQPVLEHNQQVLADIVRNKGKIDLSLFRT